MQVTTCDRAARLGAGAEPSGIIWGLLRAGVSVKQAAIARICALLALAGSPVGAQVPAQSAKATTLVVQDAWIRATPGTDVAAAYLTLRNPSTSPVTVTGVESPIAGHVMIHETRVQGGQAQMRPHEQIVVAPGATVKLQPGGLHVMLHDLKQPLTVGQSVPLLITLAGGSTVQVTAAVRPLNAE
jgi:periplasmic copper chaperone A